MKCPNCGCSSSRVIKSRVVDPENALQRYRKCLDCKTKYTTFERLAVYVGRDRGWAVNDREVYVPIYPPAQEACG